MKVDVVVKKSGIRGKGVFAARNFKKGEKVLEWHPVILKRSELKDLPAKDRHYLEKSRSKYLLMQAPERYVNHSCEPNTYAKNGRDLALRSIKRGEEITSYYKVVGVSFKCNCGSKNCRGTVLAT